MKYATRICVVFIILCISGCFSFPIRNPPSINNKYENMQLGSVAILGCTNPDKPELHEVLICDWEVDDFARKLERTQIFEQVIIGKNVKADYSILLLPIFKLPYYGSMFHNPGLLLFSLVIPFWETKKYGDEFIILSKKSGQDFHINNIEEGTDIMWLGSLLINILPDRGFSDYESETMYLRNSIIKTISENVPNNQTN